MNKFMHPLKKLSFTVLSSMNSFFNLEFNEFPLIKWLKQNRKFTSSRIDIATMGFANSSDQLKGFVEL